MANLSGSFDALAEGQDDTDEGQEVTETQLPTNAAQVRVSRAVSGSCDVITAEQEILQ